MQPCTRHSILTSGVQTHGSIFPVVLAVLALTGSLTLHMIERSGIYAALKRSGEGRISLHAATLSTLARVVRIIDSDLDIQDFSTNDNGFFPSYKHERWKTFDWDDVAERISIVNGQEGRFFIEWLTPEMYARNATQGHIVSQLLVSVRATVSQNAGFAQSLVSVHLPVSRLLDGKYTDAKLRAVRIVRP